MLDPFKKALLSLLGGVPLTPEETRRIVDDLVSRGGLTGEQGKKLLQLLLVEGKKEGQEVRDRWGREVERLARLVPLVSRGEFQRLQERVRKLEEKLGAPPEAPEAPPEAPDEVPSRSREGDG